MNTSQGWPLQQDRDFSNLESWLLAWQMLRRPLNALHAPFGRRLSTPPIPTFCITSFILPMITKTISCVFNGKHYKTVVKVSIQRDHSKN